MRAVHVTTRLFVQTLLFLTTESGAIMDNQRIRQELAPALMQLYSSCHAVSDWNERVQSVDTPFYYTLCLSRYLHFSCPLSFIFSSHRFARALTPNQQHIEISEPYPPNQFTNQPTNRPTNQQSSYRWPAWTWTMTCPSTSSTSATGPTRC